MYDAKMLTKYNQMWKIINFKEIIYGPEAFFDSLTLAISFNSFRIEICTLKSHEFTFDSSRGLYKKKIGVKVKLPFDL